MRRAILALALILAAVPAFADDWTPQPRPGWSSRRRPEWGSHRHDGAHVTFGHDYTVAADTTTSGPVVVIGGNATIDGRVDEDVVVVGGEVRVGPTASVAGDVVAVGGRTIIDPKASVSGEVTDLAIALPPIQWPWVAWSDRWWQVLAISFTVFRLVLTTLLAVLLALMFPHSIGRVSDRIAARSGKAFLVGLGAQVLFVPALMGIGIALAVSVVGIPMIAVLPVAVILTGGVAITGFTGVAARVGASFRGVSLTGEPTVSDVFIGVVALLALSTVGQLLTLGPSWMAPFAFLIHTFGLCIEYIAWTIGAGAGISTLFGRRSQVPSLPTSFPMSRPA